MHTNLLILLLAAAAPIGIFDSHDDVGAVLHNGSVQYDAAAKSYTITGSGENMWFGKDELHLVWKKVSGDFTLSADVAFPDAGGNAHRKAVLIARQTLATDSPYADVAVHGDGLTSLQTRETPGVDTHEVGVDAAHPRSVRLEKRGDVFYMWLAGANEQLRFSGAAMRVALKPPFYVGIGVCSHDKDAVARAVFSNVRLEEGAAAGPMRHYRTVETISIASTDRRVVRVTDAEAPSGAEETATVAGPDDMVNCYPRRSPDGTRTAVVSYAPGTKGCPADQDVELRLISATGDTAKVLAKIRGGRGTLGESPWSADGKSLVFTSDQ